MENISAVVDTGEEANALTENMMQWIQRLPEQMKDRVEGFSGRVTQ